MFIVGSRDSPWVPGVCRSLVCEGGSRAEADWALTSVWVIEAWGSHENGVAPPWVVAKAWQLLWDVRDGTHPRGWEDWGVKLDSIHP